MKKMQKTVKYFVGIIAVAVLLVCSGSFTQVNAANGAITVTNALTSAVLYEGDDLNAALQAAERGSIIEFNRYYTMQSDVVVKSEVLLSNADRITNWNGHKLLFAGNGAVYVSSRLARKNYAALHSYSSVKVTEESGGYVYYLDAGVPAFNAGNAVTTVQNGGGVLAASVEENSSTILLDLAVSGISADTLANQVSVPAEKAESVSITVAGNVINGATLTASATNYDYAGTVTKTYTLIVVGDVNGNGRIDAADANLIACHASGLRTLTGNALRAADANGDGLVNAADADLLCRKYIRANSYSSPLG